MSNQQALEDLAELGVPVPCDPDGIPVWSPGFPCASCGSADTYGPVPGCRTCGRSDADED